MPTSSVLINPTRLWDIRDVDPWDFVERVNQAVIEDVLNDELDRPGSNAPEPVPLLLDVVHAGLELIFQVRDNIPEFIEHGLDVFVVHIHDLVFHPRPFVTDPGENIS